MMTRCFFLLFVLPLLSVGGKAEASLCQPVPLSGPVSGPVHIPAGLFMAGQNPEYPEEGPAHLVSVNGFYMDRHEVTNAQFAAFVDATGYVTEAEKEPAPGRSAGGFVFTPPKPDMLAQDGSWWQFTSGANWRHPYGPDSTIDGKDSWPVVQVTEADAQAYAVWAKGRLPTEDEWEYAAQTGETDTRVAPVAANTWQGAFPGVNTERDGYAGSAPVGCYDGNAFGLYDMIGNVWELTASPYLPRRDAVAGENRRNGHDPKQPGTAVVVIKGGSYLCAENYCARFRPAARQAQDRSLATSHVGFRLVYDR